MNLTILGSGVTGQATGMGLTKHGHKVVFYDIDKAKLAKLEEKGYFVSSSLNSAIQESNVVFICVPTPTIDNSMDFSFIEKAIIEASKALREKTKYCVVVLRSTVLPTTTRCRVVPLLEKYTKLKAGRDFGVCMNPEFLRENSASEDFLNAERIVIGEYDTRSGDVLEKVFSSFNVPIIRTSLDNAEMIKYAANLFLASKISFFNEIHMICEMIGVDSEIVSRAVSLDSRIGEYGVKGGRPFDGKCLPKDLEAFRSFVKSFKMNPKLLDAVSFVNDEISKSRKTIKGG